MSQLSQLKQQIEAIGNSAQKAGNGLESFSSNFRSQIQSVQSTIGGSAQGKDQKIISDLQTASSAVTRAAQALQTAARTAKSYGSSL